LSQFEGFFVTLVRIKKLSNHDNRIVVFEQNTHTNEKGSFQLALADETDGLVSLTMAGFVVNSSERINRILFFKSSKEKTSLQVSSMTGTLDTDIYSLVRKDIITKLGENVNKYIAALEI
jgi:hypothetical protein